MGKHTCAVSGITFYTKDKEWDKVCEKCCEVICECKDGWISVYEYNPPFNTCVLSLIKHNEDVGAEEIQVCILNIDNGSWEVSKTYEDTRPRLILKEINATVTHWMPMPEPPND